MPDLLEALTNFRRTEPERFEPRFSRKYKRVIVTVYVEGVRIDVSVSIKRLDKAIDRVCRFSGGIGPPQGLLDQLLWARQKYGHIIDGKKKSRGSQVGREAVLYDLQYACAWTYCFIRSQWGRSEKNRHRLLQDAESTLLLWLREKKRERDWDLGTRSWQIRLLTGFLVGNAFADDRNTHGLCDPLAKYPDFKADSFYRTYVQPKLKDVELRLKNRPKLVDSLSNAYLRKTFYHRMS